jgi:hypothetical protein
LDTTWAFHEAVDLGSAGVIPENQKKISRGCCAVGVRAAGVDAATAALY